MDLFTIFKFISITAFFVFVFYILIVLPIQLLIKGFKLIFHHAPIIEEKKIVGYRKRFKIMNHTESALFFELKNQLPKNYYIFPNMRIADIIDPLNGPGYYKRRNKILPRHIDFLICDPIFKPVVAIELHGSSHNRSDRIEIDEEKKIIFEEAKLPLVIVKVGHSFIDSVKDVLLYLK